jgi:hypothetical protein
MQNRIQNLSFEIVFFLQKSSQLVLKSFMKVIRGLVRVSLAVYLANNVIHTRSLQPCFYQIPNRN